MYNIFFSYKNITRPVLMNSISNLSVKAYKEPGFILFYFLFSFFFSKRLHELIFNNDGTLS